MKLVFYLEPEKVIVDLSINIYISSYGLASINGKLIELLQCREGDTVSIAFDPNTKSYFLCQWPEPKPLITPIKVYMTKEGGVLRFRSVPTANAILARQKPGKLLKGVRFSVMPEPLTEPTLPNVRIFELRMFNN